MGKIERKIEGLKRKPAANSTYKKLAVQWLNEVLCFVSSSLLTACKRHNPAAGATQGYDRLHAKRYRQGCI
jgi:hypothetical protein